SEPMGKGCPVFKGYIQSREFSLCRSSRSSYAFAPVQAMAAQALVHRLAYNSDVATARRVALKIARGRRCSSVRYRFRYAPSNASPARTALPAAHFKRNDLTIICETVH